MTRYSILSVGIDAVNEAELRSTALEWLTEVPHPHSSGRQIVTTNPEFVMEAQGNERFRAVLNHAACALADGVGLQYASRFLFGKNHYTRMTGVSAMQTLCELASTTGSSVYLVGGKENVAQKTAEILKKKYPNLTIGGAEVGIPFKGTRTPVEYTDELISRINTTQPAVLFVAFGAPKQEMWIAEHLSKMPSVRIAMGVGGTFDYLSGAVSYAPLWIRNIGLEWAYRLIKEPRRLNRIITATIRFPLAVLLSKIMK